MDRPWIDLLIGCGGWSAPLLLVAYVLVADDARRWAAVFYGLALVCNYPHYMATIHRAYARAEDRDRYRLFTTYVTGLLLLVAAAAHVEPRLLPWLFTTYVMWSPWHYTGQNFGLSMMFLRRARLDVTPRERRRLRVAFVASYVMLLAAFNQGASQDSTVLSLGLPVGVAWPIQVVAALVFIVFGALALVPIARRARGVALLPAATLYVTQACWFVIPIVLTWVFAVPVPQTRYSSGILAIMHSAQYLWITRYYARRDAARHGQAAGAWSARRYWAAMIVGGMALFLPGPWLASALGHVDFTSSVLIVTALVNIHHFILDGVVWKLRDPRVAQALVGQGANAAPAAASGAADSADAGASGTARRRPRLDGAVGRVVRPAAIALLLTLAAVDQWRYTLASDDGDVRALETASVLTPYDGRLQTRLSRSLIQAGRLDEAYAHVRRLPSRWSGDVDTLVNAGVLAYRLGDRAGAEDWWRRALARDASLPQVHLYLAELLDDATRTREALPHYQRYLELARDHPAAARAEPRQLALVVIKFADALARTGQADVAAGQYALAERIAVQTSLPDIAALARARRPRLGR